MSESSGNRPGPFDLTTPFLFVPHGDPEPTEWMAAHPGWVKFPATFVPPAADDCDTTPAPPPVAPPPVPPALAASTAATAASTAEEMLAAAEAAAGPALRLVLRRVGPLGALMYVFEPTSTASREMDERPPEPSSHAGSGGLVPPEPLDPLPGLIPPNIPSTVRGQGGFSPSPPAKPLPGFKAPEPSPPVLPGRPAEEIKPTLLEQRRNNGLVGPERTTSERARKGAAAADPAVAAALAAAEWEAHHLINLSAVRTHIDLVRAATRAGWRTDDESNLAALPGSREAQEKLESAGVDRPIHDSGHPDWNESVSQGLEEIEDELEVRRLQFGSDGYAKAAKEALDSLQRKLREEMLQSLRLTQSDTRSQTQTA